MAIEWSLWFLFLISQYIVKWCVKGDVIILHVHYKQINLVTFNYEAIHGRIIPKRPLLNWFDCLHTTKHLNIILEIKIAQHIRFQSEILKVPQWLYYYWFQTYFFNQHICALPLHWHYSLYEWSRFNKKWLEYSSPKPAF